MLQYLKILLLFVLLAFQTSGYGQFDLRGGERILNFQSSIVVDTSSVIIVTETIKVNVLGENIKHGIYRVLPKSRNIQNQTFYVKYKVLSVKKDGQTEPYSTKTEGNDFYIYIGDADKYVDNGVTTYEISYESNKQIGFWKDYDELYWNVCGNKWLFPIDSIKATVTLPQGADVLQNACYTGAYGSEEQNCTSNLLSSTTIEWFAKDPLLPQEGLTIAVGFKKGVVHEPQLPVYLKVNNLKNGLLAISALLLAFFGWTWFKYGQDPPAPTVIPEYDAPQGLSPAALGYLNDAKYTPKLITASLINMAVKGAIKIEETKKSVFLGLKKVTHYKIVKTEKTNVPLSTEEQKLYTQIGNGLDITGKYDVSVETMVKRFRTELLAKNKSLITKGSNRNKVLIPYLLIIVIYWFILIMAYKNLYNDLKLVFGIVLFILSAILYSSILSISALRYKSFWIWILASLPPLGIGLYWKYIHPELNPFTLAFIFLTFGFFGLTIFKYLIEKPSPELLKIKAGIDGFKMYLAATENQQLQFFNPPAMTPEIFEKMLPFAVVFGVDNIWGEKFSKFLEDTKEPYESHWYGGSTVGFSSSLSHSFSQSFTSSLSSSSTQPSSSGSGSGGGGSSGGGGGGGGGGGW